MRLAGKIAIVTGGASGIGRATALRFAEEGASIVVSDIDERGGAETSKELEQIGAKSIFVRTDVSKEEDVKHLINSTIEAFDGIDILFNNAGVGNSSNN